MGPVFIYCGLYVLVCLLDVASAKVNSYGGWSNSPDSQYHIQTDEGEERYFKYQTKSGQYRKEKRLQDGTVVGTYGWVDPNGYLRLRDYVADNQGYRIVKSKLIYVGTNVPESRSPSESQQSTYLPPANARPFRPQFDSRPFRFDGLPPWRTTTYLPPGKGTHGRPLAPSQAPHHSSTPLVEISANSLTGSSTPSYVTSDSVREVTVYEDATVSPIQAFPGSSRHQVGFGYGPTYAGPSEDFGPTTPRPQNGLTAVLIPPTTSQPPVSVPVRYLYASNPSNDISIGNSKPSFYAKDDGALYGPEEYDGISTVQNGFRYYLPRHYHEETSSDDGQVRAGSFGYVDPFGIRRVVYYNTSPGKGFVHKKNNRYVGFHSTPYDPRPNY